MEQGIAGAGPLVINLVDDGDAGRMDKTWQEIHDAMAHGKNCVVVVGAQIAYSIAGVLQNALDQTYIVYFITVNPATSGVSASVFTASTSDDYPIYERVG
jgi:hypothetical protein